MICSACGRVIKNADSIKNGYGPICYEKLFGKPNKVDTSYDPFENYEVPGQMDLSEFIEYPEEGE